MIYTKYIEFLFIILLWKNQLEGVEVHAIGIRLKYPAQTEWGSLEENWKTHWKHRWIECWTQNEDWRSRHMEI